MYLPLSVCQPQDYEPRRDTKKTRHVSILKEPRVHGEADTEAEALLNALKEQGARRL